MFSNALQLTVMYEVQCVSHKLTVFSNPAWNLSEETALKDEMLQAYSWNTLENRILYSGLESKSQSIRQICFLFFSHKELFVFLQSQVSSFKQYCKKK